MSKVINLVGRMVKDARIVAAEKGEFLAGTVAHDVYNKETKEKSTQYTDFTVNSFGAGLVGHLNKGAQVAISGIEGKGSEYNGKVTPSMLVNNLTFGKPMLTTHEADGKVMGFAVGRLGKDAAERAGSEDKKFLSFSVATEQYNKETKENETVWLDATMNFYGAGLVSKLVKGTGVAIEGVVVTTEEEGKTVRKFYVHDLTFFGNKKADAANEGEAAAA